MPSSPSGKLMTLDAAIGRLVPNGTWVRSPFDGRPVMVVKALRPDVAIVAVQRADPSGQAHAWGNLGIAEEAGLAAEHIILLAEEIADPAVLTSDPNRVLFPPSTVSAVVHCPGGCHPAPVQGYYGRDHQFYTDYHRETRTVEGMEAWLERWVYGVPDRPAGLSVQPGRGAMGRPAPPAHRACGTGRLRVAGAEQPAGYARGAARAGWRGDAGEGFGRGDVGCEGGAEVDRFGNVNSSYIGPRDRLRIRLPGSGGACDIASLARQLLIIMAHERRRFRQAVDFVTSPGYLRGMAHRRALGLPGGPAALITTLGILGFDPHSGEAVLRSCHPGVTVDEVRAQTGWDLRVSPDVGETPPPTAEEIRLIRRLDPQGFWTRGNAG